MGLISQLVSVTAGSLIKASQWNNEFLQIINLLNGTSTDKEVKINSAAPGAQPATLVVERGDASASNKIATFTTGGVIKGAVATTPTDTTDLTTKTYVDGKKHGWAFSIFDGVPSAAASNDESPYATFIVPETGVYYVTKIRGSYAEKVAGTDASSYTFKLRRATGNPASYSDLATITISVSNDPEKSVTREVAVSGDPLQLSEGDILFFVCTAVTGSNQRTKKHTLSAYGYSTPA